MIPMLERLEDRITPNHYTWGTPLQVVNNNWQNPNGQMQNWYDDTNGRMATSPPGAGDDVAFSAASAPTAVTITNDSATCRSITVNAGWGGRITITNGSLNVWGQNLPPGSKSNVQDGDIRGGGGVANLNVIGGRFDYGASNLNNNSTNQLEINVWNGGQLNLTNNLAVIGADLNVGYQDDHQTVSTGSVAFVGLGPAVNFVNGASVVVSSQGTFTLGANASITDVDYFASAGLVQLGSGSSMSMMPGSNVWINAGYLTLSDTGTADVWGNVQMNGNSALKMGNAQGQYSTLNVHGDLTMTNSILSIDVNAASATQSDVITADHIFLDPSDSLQAWTTGTALPGTHAYGILQTNDPNGMNGSFGSYGWFGDDPIQWIPAYAQNAFTLLGTI